MSGKPEARPVVRRRPVKRFTLSPETIERLAKIREEWGLASESAAVDWAVAVAARKRPSR